jgi:hypothetical protein
VLSGPRTPTAAGIVHLVVQVSPAQDVAAAAVGN